jgi:outer membrane protein assembly factor BamD (BamD/ComL family)
MSAFNFGRVVSQPAVAAAGRVPLSHARRRILLLRRIIRLRRKLLRAPRTASRACAASRAPRVAFHVPRAAALGLLLLAASAGVAWGCGWGGFENSVRFGFNSERTRVRLPPLPADPEGSRKTADEDGDGLTSKQRAAEVDALWDSARASVAAGDLGRARRLLGSYVGRTAGADCGEWNGPADCRARRNSALDRLDALAALDRGSPTADVRSYLEARTAYDGWLAGLELTDEERPSHPAEPTPEQQDVAARTEAERAAGMRGWDDEVEPRLDAPARDPNLADNVAYLRAAGVYRAGRPGDALEAFESVAARHPRGEKREAALYMAGRAALESSAVNLDGETSTSEDPCREPACRDEASARARKNFARLLSDYPRGLYAPDARGWLAYLDYRVGDTAAALAGYYRMLAGADAAAREQAARSLRLVRPRADDADMDAVERELEDEPEVALAYAYHNVYNYAAGYYLRVPEFAEADADSADEYSPERQRGEEKKAEALRARAERAELRRAADFASRMVARHPRARAGGAFLVRLAGAQLELGRPEQALAAAHRALAAAPSGDERARALWLAGVAEYQLKDYAAARTTLARVAVEFPRSPLATQARELLAVVAEDAGDLGGALEQYLALGYDPDVAYLTDVLMTPDQLASFVARNDSAPRRDELLYALGLRFMRAGRYAEARAALTRVVTASADYGHSSGGYGYFGASDVPAHPKLRFRHTFWDESDEDDGENAVAARVGVSRERDTRVYADWLLRDMRTLEDLERLQGEVERARGDEERAEALYQLASYFYEGELHFYNPAAWRGMRAEMIGSLGEPSYRAPAEAQTVWAYAQEHEGASRALALYLEVARLYPRTRAARDSLYTAILCHQRLSNFNGYWREMYGRGLHAGAALVTLSDLRRAYPQYRLPRAGDWKPSARTVGGAAAWPAPPGPRRLTRTERARVRLGRAERGVARAWGLFGEVYGGRVRAWTVAAARWAVVALTGCAVLLVFRRTRRARRFLYRRLARRRRSSRTRPARETYAPASSYAAHVAHARGPRLRSAATQTARDLLLRLALHERGRAALALNLFTHGLLTVLLWAVIWAAGK